MSVLRRPTSLRRLPVSGMVSDVRGRTDRGNGEIHVEDGRVDEGRTRSVWSKKRPTGFTVRKRVEYENVDDNNECPEYVDSLRFRIKSNRNVIWMETDNQNSWTVLF